MSRRRGGSDTKAEITVDVLTGNLGVDRVPRAQRHRYDWTDAPIGGSNTFEPQLLWRDNVVLNRLHDFR